MASKRRKKKKRGNRGNEGLDPETKNSIMAVVFTGVAIVLVFSGFEKAGPLGKILFKILDNFFGIGYFLIPSILLIVSALLIIGEHRKLIAPTIAGASIFILSTLGVIEILYKDGGGLLGKITGSFGILFGAYAGIVINLTLMVVGIIVALDRPIKIILGKKHKDKEDKSKLTNIPDTPPEDEDDSEIFIGGEEGEGSEASEESGDEEEISEEEIKEYEESIKQQSFKESESNKKDKNKDADSNKLEIKERTSLSFSEDYTQPPISLLKNAYDKPVVGDLRANANIIKRTLESFGIAVDMAEITIGPKVTRYTLKPAEGVKLSRITALNQDLSLALAVHPIRIEAPIPGKALVGIEVPNKSASIVRLGNLLTYSEFTKAPYLTFSLGRDVGGEPVFANLAKMPHLMIAGTTGSGKSITIHTILTSLLYKNSPQTMRMILIDPKRVELSVYEDLPHLMAPVITQGKKAVAALKFAIEEMDRRYGILLNAGKRDILGYNKGRENDRMPYIVIVIDELADLMASYGREVESSIVRLAQMARATGIHLIVSTQRPSVEVITGLIKANINSRIALQVASQVDSRTILDTAGAEKLLGGGDMLFTSTELSKPRRIQGAYLSNEEVEKVTNFIKKENTQEKTEEDIEIKEEESLQKRIAESDSMDDEDTLLEDAIQVVRESNKASASLLQRRLKVGYARAARLLDIMENKGIVGPGDGAKPREIFLDDEEE